MKKIIKTFILCVLVLNVSIFNVYADELDDLGKVVDGSVLTIQKCSENIQSTVLRGNILNQGIAKITDLGGGKVNVYGSTTCFVTCDKVTLELTLQRYSGGYWNNVQIFEHSANSTATLTKSHNVNVSKGYYYRVKGLCVAKKGSTTESKLPTTDGIWIN